MPSFTKFVLAAAVVSTAFASPSGAQTGHPSRAQDSASMDSAKEQLKAGAQRIGEGAERLGEGIKDGAIATWDAVRTGAAAAAAKLHDGKTAPKRGNASDASR